MRGHRYALRTRPGDFVVEELLDYKPGGHGAFGIYKLKKSGLETTAALRIIASRTNVPFRAIGCAGLKDRHGESVQFVSLNRKWGEKLDFAERNLSLELTGYSDREIRPGGHAGNRFGITLRRMNRQTLDVLVRNAELARGLPLPNYFDSQRFGSLRGAPRGAGPPTEAAGAPAVAAPAFDIVEMLRGNHEKALKNILTGTYRKEQSRIKALKRALAESWGNWPRCVEIAALARYENYSEIFGTLREKNDFMEALGLVRDQRLRMGALALQSWLWNEAVKARLVREMGTGNLTAVQYEAGELLFPRLGGMALKEYRVFAEGMRGSKLPMPYPGMIDRGEYERFLDGMGLELRQLEGLGELGVSLSKEERPLFVSVPDMELVGRGEDETKAQRRFWATIRFSLPAGSYATVIVKALAG